MIDNLSPEVPHRKSPTGSPPHRQFLCNHHQYLLSALAAPEGAISIKMHQYIYADGEKYFHTSMQSYLYAVACLLHIWVWGKEGTREIGRHSDWLADRQTDIHTCRPTDIISGRDRQRERERPRERMADRKMERDGERKRARQTDRQRWETDIQKQRDRQRDGGIETEKQRRRNRDRQRKTERDREFYLETETERQRVGEWERQRERKGRESGSVFLDRPLRFFGGRPVATFSANTSATPIIM